MDRRVKVMAEYGGSVVWWHGGGVGPIELEQLRLRLREWADVYDKSLNWESPAESAGTLAALWVGAR